MPAGWELDPKVPPPVTALICLKCDELAHEDDKGANFTNGKLCMKCGYYRVPREKKNG